MKKTSYKSISMCFGHTVVHLNAICGVPRAIFLGWIRSGSLPKSRLNRDKLQQLLIAADIFLDAGFVPTVSSMIRTIEDDQSFIGLMRSGGDGRILAEKLIRIDRRGSLQGKKLEAMLAGRSIDCTKIGMNIQYNPYPLAL